MSDIEYRQIIPELLARIPEIQKPYDTEQVIWAPEPVHPHVAVGSLLANLITENVIAWE